MTDQPLAATHLRELLPITPPPSDSSDGRVIYCRYNSRPSSWYECNTSMKVLGCRTDGTRRHTVAPSLLGPNRWALPVGFTLSGEPMVAGVRQTPEAAAYEEETKLIHPSGTESEVYRAGKHLACLTRKAPGNFHSSARDTSRGLVFRAAFGDDTYIYLRHRNGRFSRIAELPGYHADISISGDIAYHHPYGGYQLILNDSKVETPHPWNFFCSFSPDGRHLLFVAGSDNDHTDVWIAESDGSNPRQIASRRGYTGVIPMFDNSSDFHGRSSNLPCWGRDASHVYYTATIGESDEFCCVDILTGSVTQLTSSPPGSWWSNPKSSCNGKRLAVTGCMNGVRNIYVTDFASLWSVTNQKPGDAVAWPSIY